MEKYEADDGLASAAAKFAEDDRVDHVYICSPDKDLAQCVISTRVVCFDRRKKKAMDADGVREKFGVSPASIPDYLALVGDTADGIPGIPRWGAKSTATVLARYDHLESIPDDALKWDVKVRSAAALAQNLAGARADAMLYRDLATLRTDAEIPQSLEEMKWSGVDHAELASLCERLGDDPARIRLPDPS
jgi:5'-3' exonuclease